MKKHTKKAIIITAYIERYSSHAGSVHTAGAMPDLPDPDDTFIICADGGYDHAVASGLRPDLILGDLDSMDSDPPSDIETVRFDPEKDYTDLELCVKTALERGMRNVEILGGIGGRPDHALANLQILASYADSFESLVMKDPYSTCFALTACGGSPRSVDIPADKGCYISLLSLSDRCEGVTAKGVKYTLEDHVLTNTYPLGVSNEFESSIASVSVKKGILLIMLTRK